MNEDYIKKITASAEKRGHEVRIRDVAYALLRYKMDAELAYMVVFGVPKENEVETYESAESTKYLIKTVAKDLIPKVEKTDKEILADILAKKSIVENSNEGDITFEENKSAIVELIKRTEEALEDGRLDTDKGFRILTDLRVKLNDKFKVADKAVQQFVYVQPKCNHICEWTHRECWLQTKEYAMEHWHLIEDPKYKP